MPKNTVYDWDTTAANNTDVGGTDIDEGCAPSGMNNAHRAEMAQIADWRDQLTFRDAGGSADALTLTPAVALTAYASRLVVTFRATETNTGAATLNVSGLGAKAIRKIIGGVDVAVDAGDIEDNGRFVAVYDTTANSGNGAFILIENPVPDRVRGTATNDSAAAGFVGEYRETEVLVGSQVSLTTDTAANIASLSLTAGDWDVRGVVNFNPGATTSVTRLTLSISATSATTDSSPARFIQHITAAFVPNATMAMGIPPVRISLASTTTIYLVATSTFTVSTMAGYGRISARRVR